MWLLEKPAEIREVYKRISGSEKGEEWNPVQIVCEKCGKVEHNSSRFQRTTRRKNCGYMCEPHKVKWPLAADIRESCPYMGRGKFPFKWNGPSNGKF